jgi:hypothetical protein
MYSCYNHSYFSIRAYLPEQLLELRAISRGNNYSPVNLRFYLKLIAKEFISTVISS